MGRVEITVTPVPNHRPIARDDEVVTTMDVPIVIDVLANDEDQDGDVLSVGQISLPRRGTVQRQLDELLLYTPWEGSTGNDYFHYTIVDGNGGTDSAKVSIEVQSED